MSRFNFFKDTNSEKFLTNLNNRNELYNTLKKKSIITLLWICAINVLKLTFFILSSFFYTVNSKSNVTSLSSKILMIVDSSLLILPVIFTFFCIYLIVKSKNSNTSESLFLSVKNARNGLKLYLFVILIAYLIIIYITIYLTIVEGINNVTLYDVFSFYASLILTCIVSTILILLILWLLYKLLYSRLLKRLNLFYSILKDMI